MSESGKFHSQNLDRRRDKPAGCIMHFLSPSLTALCNRPGAGLRPKTKVPANVTCPACLKRMALGEYSHGPR